MQPLIVIPARLAATRLPGKPLAPIGDAPMVVQVMRRAQEAQLGRVVVACDAETIADAVRDAGGEAVLTRADHPSGSDRVWEAVEKIESEYSRSGACPGPRAGGATHGSTGKPGYDVIVNLQGDVPTLDPRLLHALLQPLSDPAVDIATLATPIVRAEEHGNPSVVKAVLSFIPSAGIRTPSLAGEGTVEMAEGSIATALYFTRAAAPSGEGPRYHHIGVYAYRREALARFVALPPSPLEQREKLEQLRALEHGLRIGVAVVDTVPLGVDTPEDLERARALLE